MQGQGQGQDGMGGCHAGDCRQLGTPTHHKPGTRYGYPRATGATGGTGAIGGTGTPELQLAPGVCHTRGLALHACVWWGRPALHACWLPAAGLLCCSGCRRRFGAPQDRGVASPSAPQARRGGGVSLRSGLGFSLQFGPGLLLHLPGYGSCNGRCNDWVPTGRVGREGGQGAARCSH